jgi:hypothetical protein
MDYSGATETFLIDYFFMGIVFSKTYEFLLKVCKWGLMLRGTAISDLGLTYLHCDRMVRTTFCWIKILCTAVHVEELIDLFS